MEATKAARYPEVLGRSLNKKHDHSPSELKPVQKAWLLILHVFIHVSLPRRMVLHHMPSFQRTIQLRIFNCCEATKTSLNNYTEDHFQDRFCYLILGILN